MDTRKDNERTQPAQAAPTALSRPMDPNFYSQLDVADLRKVLMSMAARFEPRGFSVLGEILEAAVTWASGPVVPGDNRIIDAANQIVAEREKLRDGQVI